MIFNETFDFLWSKLAAATDKDATRRNHAYQRKRLRRALLARSLKTYFLEASWINTTGAAGEETVAMTLPVTEPLIVLDGAIRTQGPGSDNNNFNIWMRRTAGDSRVQVSKDFVKDEHLLTPAQAAIRNVAPVLSNSLGCGQPWPLTWPVPVRLLPNELLQLKARVAVGGVPADGTTFTQFRALKTNNNAIDDQVVKDLRDYIARNDMQRPVYLSMFTVGSRSIVFPATGALQRTTAETREAEDPLLVIGYAVLTARSQAGGNGSSADIKWRLQADNGYSFSKEEIDINTFAFAGPGYFWQQFPHPFLLPKGSSLSANFSTLNPIADELERLQNYVIFRCCTV